MYPFREQSNFYTNTYKTEQPALTNEKYFYSKTNFEPSPLNRISESYAPGNSWADFLLPQGFTDTELLFQKTKRNYFFIYYLSGMGILSASGFLIIVGKQCNSANRIFYINDQFIIMLISKFNDDTF